VIRSHTLGYRQPRDASIHGFAGKRRAWRLVTDTIHTRASAAPVREAVVNFAGLPARADPIAMMVDTFGVKANHGQTKGEHSDGTAVPENDRA